MLIPKGRKRWIHLILTYRGSALERIKLRLLAVFSVALLVTETNAHYDLLPHSMTVVPFSLIGLALSIFLGFRNNTSYDRFWEGRKLWGSLVNVSRSLARQAATFVGAAPDEASDALPALSRELVHRTIAYVHALRMHLRAEMRLSELAEYLSAEELAHLADQRNVPIAILLGSARRLRAGHAAGQIHTYHLPALDQSLSELTNIQGGCERIQGTPIPHSYTVLIHRIVAVYCFGLPFGIVETLGSWTPVVTLIVAYAFLGLDAVGDEIEEPFGTDPNDLPLSAISRTIEINLRQALGETRVPEPLAPVDGQLT